MVRHAKFRQNQPYSFLDIVIFRFSRWPPSAVLDYEILKFLVSLQVGRAKMHHPTIKIGRMAAEISYLTFSKMAAVRHLGFVGQILGRSTTRIWWSITVQNLVVIALVILKIQQFEYFAHLA